MANLLENPSFEGGWLDDGNCQIPVGWGWWCADESVPNPIDANPWSEFKQPEVKVMHRDTLPADEQDAFVLDGQHTLKIFKGSGAWYGGFGQEIWLEPALYVFTVKVFGDLVKDYDGVSNKVWANDPLGRDGQFRFTLGADGVGDWEPIWPPEEKGPPQLADWNEFTLEFAADGDTHIGFEIMCPFALKNSGVFIDDCSLLKVAPGGEYQVGVNVITLPQGAPREHAHVLVDMLYDELG